MTGASPSEKEERGMIQTAGAKAQGERPLSFAEARRAHAPERRGGMADECAAATILRAELTADEALSD
jgi:hypothetical protein